MIRAALSGVIALLGACAPVVVPGGSPPVPPAALATATIVVARAADTLTIDDSTRAALLPAASGVQWRVEPSGLAALSALGDSLLVTREPAIIDLASDSERFIVTPLRWDLTYVLVARSPSDILPVERSGADRLRRDLAASAVQVSARPADLLYWWTDKVLCDSSVAEAAAVRPAIGYPADDATAGMVASRLAAITSSGAEQVTAVPLAERELGFALADARLAGIVLPVGTTRGSPLPWSLACGVTLTPLIDIRAHFIHRVMP